MQTIGWFLLLIKTRKWLNVFRSPWVILFFSLSLVLSTLWFHNFIWGGGGCFSCLYYHNISSAVKKTTAKKEKKTNKQQQQPKNKNAKALKTHSVILLCTFVRFRHKLIYNNGQFCSKTLNMHIFVFSGSRSIDTL